MVFCYKGWRYNYTAVRVAGLKTIAASYPKGQELLKKEEKLRTDSGPKAVWEYWRGSVDAGGQTVFLESPMGIIAAKSGWILMLGFTPASSCPQLEEDFMKILKSAKEAFPSSFFGVKSDFCQTLVERKFQRLERSHHKFSS